MANVEEDQQLQAALASNDVNVPSDGEPNNNQPDYAELDPAILEVLAAEDGTSALYKFAKDQHIQILLNNIRALWNDEQLIDVSIASVEKDIFKFHGILLAGYSSIFKTILTSGNMQWLNGILAPRDVQSELLQNLQDCMYNPGKFLLDMEQATQRNARVLMEFASFFGLEDIAVTAFIDYQRVLDNWHMMFDKRELTFSVLKTRDSEIPCHGLVLAACSPTFRESLPYNPNDPLAMLNFPLVCDDFPNDIIEKLIKFVYTATLEIDGTVTQLLFASCKLRLLAAAKACCNFIKNNLNPDSCISYLIVASNAVTIHNDPFCKALYTDVENFIVEHFSQVMITDDFRKKVTEGAMVKYMSKADLSEIETSCVIEALLAWHAEDQTGRMSAIGRLLALATSLMDRNGLSHILKLSAKMNQPKLKYLENMAGHLATPGRQGPSQQQ